MSKSDFKDIIRVLRHNFDPARRESVEDLYNMPNDLLEDARRLNSMTLSLQLLKYYTSATRWRWLPEFIDEVVQSHVELKTWRRGGILFPHFSVETLVKLDVTGILSILAPKKEEQWLQFKPNRVAWEDGESVTGAPAVKRDELRYDWVPPEHVWRVTQNEYMPLLEVNDIVITTRRWIGAQIAWRANKFGEIRQFKNAMALFESVFPNISDPSPDALIATSGILRENRILGPDLFDVPGFRGPPVWFQ